MRCFIQKCCFFLLACPRSHDRAEQPLGHGQIDSRIGQHQHNRFIHKVESAPFLFGKPLPACQGRTSIAAPEGPDYTPANGYLRIPIR